MFEVLEDKATIKQTFPCGKVGPLIDTHRHGPTYTTWKLVTDLEQHAGTKTNPNCKVCSDALYKNKELLELEAFFDEMLENVREEREKMNKIFQTL